ncbi:MAG: hypothetical protein QOD14_1001 [Solirubrobacterales bacterium]|jgi:hypothetical protein|nr:hypothetical protein [Solirubrobacterales bacterium]
MRGKTGTFAVAAAGALALLLVAFGGSAVAKDRNHDQIPDKWEKKFHLSLKVDQANKDQDKDHVDNLNEFQEGTSPRSKDSNHNGRPDGLEDADHDGLNNAAEDQTANLPNDQDTDNNGVLDGAENAGTIAGFDGTTLTIDLAGGGQVSGTVDASTEIKCETEDQLEADDSSDPGVASTSSDDGSSDDGSSDDGSTEDLPGDSSGDGGSVCTTADLTPGTPVHEAELSGTTFEKVELVK